MAETIGGPSSSRRSHASPSSGTYSQSSGRKAEKKAARLSPSAVRSPASARNASWKWLKFRRSGTSSISDRTRAAKARRAGSPPSASRFSMPRQISTSTRIRCATSLRVSLMFDCRSTLLREVLLSWMSYWLVRMPLNWVPSKPAVPHTSVIRVGSR